MGLARTTIMRVPEPQKLTLIPRTDQTCYTKLDDHYHLGQRSAL